MNFNVKDYYHHFVALIIFFIASVFFLFPQLQGKKLNANDLSQWKAMANEILEYKDQTGDVALWTGSMFSGMPTYQIHTPQQNNLLQYVENIFTFGFSYPIGFFLVGLLSMYCLFLVLGVNRWLAIIGALFFVFSTTYPILMVAGHVTKFKAIMTSPLLIAGVILLSRKKWFLGMALYSFGFGINLYHNHIQMTYYLGMVVSIFVIIKMVEYLRNKSYKDLGKLLGFLVLGSILAVGSSASKLMTTYEYSKQTMRGEPILESVESNSPSSSNVLGLDWNYAMNWSNGWDDLFSSFHPLAVGGGSIETVSRNSAFAKAIGSRKDTQAPLYHGGLPSTAGPAYFGILVFFFFILGAFVVKDPIKWWILIGIILTMLISLGSNFEIFNRIIFDNLPLYNKFRTPNSILNVTAIFIPILGVLGLNEILNRKDKTELIKPFVKISAGFLGLIILMLFMSGFFVDFVHPNDVRYEQIINPLIETRKEVFSSFLIKGILILMVGLGALYFFLKKKISSLALIVLLGILGCFDLISIDKRYLNSDSFKTTRNYEAVYQTRPVDDQILLDPDIHYRVFDISSDPFNNAYPSYHHKTIGGYHPAKLQRYQDIIEAHISRNNINVLNMLNTKYVISPGNNNVVQAQENPGHLGNAWLVSQITPVNTANEEINALNDFDLATTAIIHNEFSNYIKKNSFSGNGTITLEKYSPNQLDYTFSSNEDQFVVFSEVWYNPGWNAYLDGVRVEHIRVNYVLRGMNIPAGNHSIRFSFEPTSYVYGNWISLICSFLIILFGVFVGYKKIIQN